MSRLTVIALMFFVLALPMRVGIAEESDYFALCRAILLDPSALAPLLEQGADPNAVDSTRSTPLMYAANFGDVYAIKVLLDHGALVDQTSTYGDTALQLAAWEGHLAATELLLAAGANPNHQVQGLFTPLIACILGRHPELVTTLLAAGADPMLADRDGMTPLHWAVSGRWPKTVTTLIAAGADPHARAQDGKTPLLALWKWNTATFQTLLEYGVDVNACDSNGRLLLHSACESNDPDPEMVRGLLAAGALPEIVPKPGELSPGTPLYRVVLSDLGMPSLLDCVTRPAPFNPTLPRRRLEVAFMLLRAGADPDGQGSPPLRHAAYRGELPLVQLLLNSGADPDGGQPGESSPLMFAAGAGHVDCCKTLLASGADINWLDEKGASALSFAVDHNQVAVVRWLLEQGANPSMGRVFFDSTESLLHYAQSNDRPEIAALLEAALIDDHWGCRRKGART